MSITRIRSQFTVRDTDPLVNSHRVQDIHILPGVAMLDAVCKTLQAQRMDLSRLALRTILFHEPVVTNAAIDRKLTVTVDLQGAEGRITVSSVPWKHDRALASDVTTHMTCLVAPTEPFASTPASACAQPLPSEAVDLDACYGVTRHIGIFHDGFMKCHGRVALLPSGRHLGDVALGPEAFARGEDFLLHPVFLDCATIVPLFPLHARLDQATLFIPFAIEEFQAVAFTGRRNVRVLVEPLDPDAGNRELLRYSFGIFDQHGRQLAAIRHFTVKKVRSLQNIRGLLERSLTLQAAQMPAPAPAAVPPPQRSTSVGDHDTRRHGDTEVERPKTDPIGDLIGELLGSKGNFIWNPDDARKPFFELGLDSLALLDAAEALETRLGVRLYPTALFENPDVAALTAHLRTTFPDACDAYARQQPVGAESRPTDSGAPGGASVEATDAATPTAKARPASTVTVAPGSARRPEVLVPRWRPVRPEVVEAVVSRPAADASPAPAIAILGPAESAAIQERLQTELGNRIRFRSNTSASADAIVELSAALASGLSVDEVCLVAADHDFAFATIKALIQAGRLRGPLTVRAITLDCFRVHEEAPREDAAHGVWGLLQSLSREYPQVSVAQIDLSSDDVARGSTDWVARAMAAVPSRTLHALRAGGVYSRALYPAATPAKASPTQGDGGLRQGGTYLVVGGASGVGLEFVRHLRRNYAARVAVVGRRPENAEIVRMLSAEGEYGRDVLYLSASVDDEPALTRAIQAARAQLGNLHGIVHSAMVLEDARLADMDDAALARVLQPKVAGATALARATAALDLDFVLFFSSAQSFIGNIGQANYAAASTFIDGFANALRATRRHRVIVINWGFWGEVGAVANDRYRQLLARQGVYGLATSAALATLDEVLASGWEQAAIVSADESVLEEMGLDRTVSVERAAATLAALPRWPSSPVAAEDTQVFEETAAAMTHVLEVTRQRVGRILTELLAGRPVDEALASGALAAQHARLVRALVAIAHGGEHETTGMSQAEFAAAIARIREQHPALRPLLPLLESCIAAYPRVLAGKAAAATALFPGGGVDLVGPVYGQSAVSRFYNGRLAQAVLSLAGQAGGPLRILEIGAGTGSTTTEVLDTLARAGVACEYCYTDLWDKLVNDARARLGAQYPNLRFAFFDVSADPGDHGIHDEFDVVIATNVLHATRDLHASLRHAKRLLRPGGALVLNESVEVQEYSTYTFGLLPGWWNAIDPQERLADSPLVAASHWPVLLQDEGFVQVRTLVPVDSQAAAVHAQQVYVAFSDGELRAVRATKPVAATSAAATAATATPTPATSGLPPALADKLRPFAPPAAPRAKHVATYRDHRDHIWVFLNHAPANMFTDEFLGELCATLQSVATLPAPEGRLVYLSHFGEYFSLGGDRSELVRKIGDADAVTNFAEKARALIQVITSLDAVVVAVLDGTAQGGGLETLLATDLQVVRAGVRLGLPEIKSGLIPGMGGLTYLQDTIGPARTKRLVMQGDLIDAEEAHRWGLVSHVAADPFAAALALGDGMKNLEAAIYMKRMLRRETAERLTADIDDWVAYITRHAEWIDIRRISNSKLVVTARAAMLAS